MAGHVRLQPVLGGELLATGGAGQLLPVDLGVELEVALYVGLIVTLSTFELRGVRAALGVGRKVLGADKYFTSVTLFDPVSIEVI